MLLISLKKKDVCLMRYNINDIFIRMDMIIEYGFYIFENVKFVLCMEIDVGKYKEWIRFFKDKIVLFLKLEMLL